MSVARRAAVRYNKLVGADPRGWISFRYQVLPSHANAYSKVSSQKRWVPIGLRQPYMLRW